MHPVASIPVTLRSSTRHVGISMLRNPLTFSLDPRALVEREIRREQVDALGGNEVGHGVSLGLLVGVELTVKSVCEWQSDIYKVRVDRDKRWSRLSRCT